MTNNLKIEVLVSNIPEDGSIASQFPSQEYVNQQLAKKANLSPEGRLDPSHAPDYTEIPGLYEHIEDTKDAIETSIADSLQDAKGYTNQQLSTSLQTKADLVNGKIPFDQIPFSADIEDQIQINVENITAVVDQKVAQVVEQVNGVATAANSYTDTKVAENKTYVDTTVGNVIEDVERLGVSKAVTIPTYLTPEAGVAAGTGVAAGAYYNVRSTEDDTMLVEYQNIGGVPTPSGKSYPSSVAVRNIAKYTALPFVTGETYGLHERVQLENGDSVQSTVPNNIIDPNVDMTGWKPSKDSNVITTVKTIADLIAIQNPKEGQVVFVKSYNAGFFVGGGIFIYDSAKSAVNNNGTIINGWCRPKSKTINFNEFGLFDGKTYTSSVYFAPYVWGVENGYTKFNMCNNVTITSPFTYSFSSDSSTSLEINGGKHIFDYGSPLTAPTDCILLWFSANVDIELNIHIDCEALGSYINKPIYARSIFVAGGRKFTGKIRCENVYGYGLFADCPNVEIDDYVAIDCWGNNIIKGTLAFDAYGDGLYLSCKQAIVNNPIIINTKSISRAGIVVESLVAGKLCNVTINNPTIKGYDRGIHSESMQTDSSLTVVVNDGSIRECNTGNLVFSLSNAICDLTMNNVTQETLVRPNPVIDHSFPSGHIMGSGAGVSIKTNGCTFMKQVASSQIIGNSAYESNNDTWLKGSIGIAAAWCNRFKITDLNGRECDGRIDFTAVTRAVMMSNIDWGGTILIDNLDYSSMIKGINFINAYGNCGTLIINSNIGGCRFKDITFDTPPANWYAIENNWIRDGLSPNYDISNPSFDNIIVYGGSLFRNGGAVYRRTLPSFALLNGVTNKID